MAKQRILVFIDWFLPAYKAGGPIQSVKNIVSILSVDFDFYIVTGDRDLGDAQPFRNIQLNRWVSYGNSKIFYLTPENQNCKYYKKLILELSAEKIYFNSVFSFRFTFLPLLVVRFLGLGSKVILAPRGMLGQGAIKIKKKKKKLFLLLCRTIGVYKNVVWHASSDQEKKEIEKNIGKNSLVIIAMNLSNCADYEWEPKIKKRGEVDLFFVSRISRKKNLLFALNLLLKIKQISVNFHIIGTIEEPDYWQECQTVINQMPSNIHINYIGHVKNELLYNVIRGFHFLFFPTFHENFGHVIVESLQAGCPLIISDKTPWHALHEKNIGWDIALDDPVFFMNIIEQCALMDEKEYNKMSFEAFSFAKKIINSPEVINQNRLLFKS